MMSFSFGCEGSNEGVDGKCSCGGMQELCDQVASKGSRHTGNGYSFLGSVWCGSRRGRVVLQMWHSIEGDGSVLGGRRIHRDDGRCLQDWFLVCI